MSDWHEFDAVIEPVRTGKATYTILRLPAVVSAAFEAAGIRRVEGEMNEHPVNLALSRAPFVDSLFLWTGRSLLDRLGIGPFEAVSVRLRAAHDDAVDLPEDVGAALLAGGVAAQWDSLSPGKRRGLLYKIGTARTEATRTKRIAALAAELQGPTE